MFVKQPNFEEKNLMSNVGKFSIGGIVFAVLFLFFWAWGATTFKPMFLYFIAPGWPVILLFLAAIGLGIFAYLKEIGWVWVPSILVGLLAIFIWIILPYQTAHQYASSVKETSVAAPSYDQRTPFVVADQAASRNLQDNTGSLQNTKSLAARGTNGQWDTLVIRRGVGVGYEANQSMNTPLYGQVDSNNPKDVQLCKFSQNAALRIGGALPNNDLSREIFQNTPINVGFESGDVYSYCSGDTPYVVVPLRVLNGFYAPTWAAYGDAVYNGHTGDLRVLTTQKEIAKIPGPVYPISLAADTREAYQASGDIWSFWQGRSGYSTSSDDNDPNLGNDSEFGLRKTGTNDVNYVTPLTPRGSSTQLVALGTVDSSKIESGHRNTLVIYKYTSNTDRQANSSTENAIRTQYSWMPDWASGMEVFEVVPADNDLWVASIGQTQSVTYRATITAAGKITLYNSKGLEVTQAFPQGVPKGGATPTPPAGGTGGTTVAINANTDLTQLSATQLQDLGNAILKELATRAAAAAKASQ
jgi:hypothetical protein